MRLLPYFSCSRFLPGLSWFLYACYPGPLLGSSPGFLGAGKCYWVRSCASQGDAANSDSCRRIVLTTLTVNVIYAHFSLTDFSCKSSFWPDHARRRATRLTGYPDMASFFGCPLTACAALVFNRSLTVPAAIRADHSAILADHFPAKGYGRTLVFSVVG